MAQFSQEHTLNQHTRPGTCMNSKFNLRNIARMVRPNLGGYLDGTASSFKQKGGGLNNQSKNRNDALATHDFSKYDDLDFNNMSITPQISQNITGSNNNGCSDWYLKAKIEFIKGKLDKFVSKNKMITKINNIQVSLIQNYFCRNMGILLK